MVSSILSWCCLLVSLATCSASSSKLQAQASQTCVLEDEASDSRGMFFLQYSSKMRLNHTKESGTVNSTEVSLHGHESEAVEAKLLDNDNPDLQKKAVFIALWAIFGRAPGTSTVAATLDMLKERNGLVVGVFYDDETMIAGATFYPFSDESYGMEIEYFGTDPNYKGRGAGKAAFNLIVKYATDNGYTWLALHPDDAEAESFWLSRGFSFVPGINTEGPMINYLDLTSDAYQGWVADKAPALAQDLAEFLPPIEKAMVKFLAPMSA